LVAETWLGVGAADGDGLGRIRIFSGLPCAGSHGTERRELAAVQIWDTAFGGVSHPRDVFIGGAKYVGDYEFENI